MSRFTVLLALLAACDPPTETATIGALRQPCIGFEVKLCLLMGAQEPLHPEFAEIEGYVHHWGTQSEITFYREPVDSPESDSPSERMILVEIIEENVTITAPFQLDFPVDGPDWFSGSGPSVDMLGTPVVCEDEVCDQLGAADLSESPFAVTMELTDDPQTLRATAVLL